MDKIYITNFWYAVNNYGANLTAFALQHILNKKYDSSLINNSDKLEENKNINIDFSYEFKNKYLNHTNFIGKTSELVDFNKYSDIFITGSDQIFRPIYTQDKMGQFLLDFAMPSKKKIAFSASFGVDKEQFLKENSEDIIEHMKKSLESFDFISVREKSGVEICKDIFGVDAEWIIDPVFILEKSNYDRLIENANQKILKQVQNDSIVTYVLDTSKEYRKSYKYLEKKYNKKVVEIANSNISIENWLASIRDCELFVTDSFHGMCFAIIFNKSFICLANKDRGRARFDSICEMLDIENQCIDSIIEVMQRDCVFKVDYKGVNKRIEEERQRGLEFLQKALEAPASKTQEKIDARMQYLEKSVCELEEQNNLSYQLKKYIWEKWLIVYHCYLPMPIKKCISFFWQMIKRMKKCT